MLKAGQLTAKKSAIRGKDFSPKWAFEPLSGTFPNNGENPSGPEKNEEYKKIITFLEKKGEDSSFPLTATTFCLHKAIMYKNNSPTKG